MYETEREMLYRSGPGQSGTVMEALYCGTPSQSMSGRAGGQGWHWHGRALAWQGGGDGAGEQTTTRLR